MVALTTAEPLEGGSRMAIHGEDLNLVERDFAEIRSELLNPLPVVVTVTPSLRSNTPYHGAGLVQRVAPRGRLILSGIAFSLEFEVR